MRVACLLLLAQWSGRGNSTCNGDEKPARKGHTQTHTQREWESEGDVLYNSLPMTHHPQHTQRQRERDTERERERERERCIESIHASQHVILSLSPFVSDLCILIRCFFSKRSTWFLLSSFQVLHHSCYHIPHLFLLTHLPHPTTTFVWSQSNNKVLTLGKQLWTLLNIAKAVPWEMYSYLARSLAI